MANNTTQQTEQSDMNIVVTINQIDSQISELYKSLEALSVEANPDLSKQNKILKQISDLQNLKSNLYTNLSDSYSEIQSSVVESRNSLVNETVVSNVIQNELSNVTNNLNTLKNSTYDKVRLAEINNYYSSKYMTQTTVMKTIVYFCIPILILGVLMKKELLPQAIVFPLISILIGVAIVIVILQFIDIWGRSNMVFDEYDWSFNPSTINVTRTGNNKDQPSKASDSTLTCIGQACCPPGNNAGTTWNAQQKICTTSTETEGFVGERCLKNVFDKTDLNVNIFKNNNVVDEFNKYDTNYAKF